MSLRIGARTEKRSPDRTLCVTTGDGHIGSSVNDNAGGAALTRAALGDDIVTYTQMVSERSSIRAREQTIVCDSSDKSPMTAYTRTRLKNAAVVERPVLPYSESGRKHVDEVSYETAKDFEVHESTWVPARAGISMIMFDMCCANKRQQLGKKSRQQAAAAHVSQAPEIVETIHLPGARSAQDGWDPRFDTHLSAPGGRPAEEALPNPRLIERTSTGETEDGAEDEGEEDASLSADGPRSALDAAERRRAEAAAAHGF